MSIKRNEIIFVSYLTLIAMKMDIYRDSIYCAKQIETTGFFIKKKKVSYIIAVCYNNFKNIYTMKNEAEMNYWMSRIPSMKSRLDILHTLRDESIKVENKFYKG